ncbi:MAG: glycosyltransferase family 4 protein [Chloroflexota bacterium]
MTAARICLTPRVSGVGGMVSFQHKLIAGLEQQGVAVTQDLDDPPYTAVLVIGGTRRLARLRQAGRAARIVQRLDGMNWLHRMGGRGAPRPTLRQYLRAEYGNLLLSLIRRRIAHAIVYQSDFSRAWWERVYRPAPAPARVIHNAVDLQQYTPAGPQTPPDDRWRVLMVEGSLTGGYEHGLQAAVALVDRLAARLEGSPLQRPVELMVAGHVPDAVRRRWDSRPRPAASIHWAGLAERQAIPAIDRAAHLLYSSDIHPACPNAVIEALACGLPVLAFDTGALPELVPAGAGQVVPYGGDAWQLDPPDIEALTGAALQILSAGPALRQSARRHAEAHFGLEAMTAAYLAALTGA